MSGRLTEIQRQVGVTRRRLEDLARRLAVLRESISAGPAGGTRAAPDTAAHPPATPLFQGVGLDDGALDDVELHFEVLDTEDPGREGR